MNTRKPIPGLAGRLKAAREGAGLSQYAAADRSGVSRVGLIKFEGEKAVPTLDVLYRLAAAYGVTVCSLLPKGEVVSGVEEPLPAPAKKPKKKAT